MTTPALSQQHNPVLRSEFAYQRFVIQRSRNGWLWIGLALLLVVPALLLALGYSGRILLNWIPDVGFYQLIETPHLALGLVLLVANVSLYPVVTLIMLALARNSITREKAHHTWGLLRLTDVPAQRIVIGKWWASLRALNGDQGMVILLRVGLLAFWLTVILPADHGLNDLSAPYRLYFLALAPLVIVHALADAALTAMIGVAGAVPDDSLGIAGGFSALVLRLLMALGVGVWFWLLLNATRTSFSAALWLALAGVAVTIMMWVLMLFVAQRMLERG